MGRIANIIHNLEEKLPKGDKWARFREDKDSVHVAQPPLNKHNTRGFNSKNGINKGWSPRGIQLLGLLILPCPNLVICLNRESIQSIYSH